MDVYDKGLVTVIACAALFVALGLPLIYRKVPRNQVYGFRIPSTLRDDTAWYETNAAFGRWFVIATIVSAACIGVIYAMRLLDPRSFITATILAMIAPVIVGLVAGIRRLRSLR